VTELEVQINVEQEGMIDENSEDVGDISINSTGVLFRMDEFSLSLNISCRTICL